VVTDAVPGSKHDLQAVTVNGGNGRGSAAGVALSEEISVPLRLPDDVGLAVIAGLADDVRIEPAGLGTSVTMIWKRRAAAF